MHEQEKLEEANYFFRRMIEEVNNMPLFRYHLSAFLSAGRSVCYYIHKAINRNPSSKQWGNDMLQNHPIIATMKVIRDHDIHHKPVQAYRLTRVVLTSQIGLSGTLDIRDSAGRVIHSATPESIDEKKFATFRVPEGVVGHEYFFDIPKTQNVLEMSEEYLIALSRIVSAGIAGGFIDG